MNISTNTTDLCSMPSNFTWSTTPNLKIIGNNMGTSIQVKALGDGLGYIHLNFTNGQKVSQKIWVGKPNVTINQNFTNLNNRLSLSLKSTIEGISVTEQGVIENDVIWYRPTQNITRNGGFNYSFSVPNMVIEYPIQITTSNKCGVQSKTEIFMPDSTDCGYFATKEGGDNYNIVNPCSDYTNSMSLLKSQNSKINNLNAVIYNSLGEPILSTNNLKFSLKSVMTGTYYLKIFKNGSLVHTQKLIKH